ncbi:fungal-specific transcription factor domain-containing protein [Cadophora sp. MPI-SDFR-AT-0126]|nr:fungal-specific transcription factor domain-containing protein [Leotiomycetes sp. MPI-SDFR-AT-0126]
MFTNFELCKAGLVSATPSRRHERTSTGCLQCRQRKKKCDERRPKCSLCLKYGSICERRRQSRQPSLLSSNSGRPKIGSQQHSDVSARKASHVVLFDSIDARNPLPQRPELSKSICSVTPSQDTPRETALCTYPDFENSSISLRAGLPSLEMVVFGLPNERLVLDFLMNKIDDLTMPRYINPKMSILHSAVPLAVASPSMKSALMACGFALLSQTSWGADSSIQATSYQCKALNELGSNLLHGSEEGNLATILLLHLFEKICCDSVDSKRLHLLGANSLIAMSQNAAVGRSAPTKVFAYLLEACIYHITLSSTFSGTLLPPFEADHVSKLLKLLGRASEDPNNMWKDSSLIGVCHGLFDAIFQVSLLRRQIPLTASNRVYAQELRELVFNWQWRSPQGDVNESSGENSPRPPEAMVRAGRLYRLSCLLLIEKILKPSLKSSDQVPRNLVTEFCHIIRQLPPEDTKQSVYLWPLLIIGTAAQTQSERSLILAPLQSNPDTSGFGNRSQGCTFLIRSWGAIESSDGALGLDILLRDDLLSEIFI